MKLYDRDLKTRSPPPDRTLSSFGGLAAASIVNDMENRAFQSDFLNRTRRRPKIAEK